MTARKARYGLRWSQSENQLDNRGHLGVEGEPCGIDFNGVFGFLQW
jgi:hypothetical protein